MSSLPWFMYATGPRKRNSLPRFSMMLKLLRPAIRVVVNGMARVSMAKYHHAHRHRHIHTQTPTHSRTHAHIHTHSHTRTHTHTQPHTISAIMHLCRSTSSSRWASAAPVLQTAAEQPVPLPNLVLQLPALGASLHHG